MQMYEEKSQLATEPINNIRGGKIHNDNIILTPVLEMRKQLFNGYKTD